MLRNPFQGSLGGIMKKHFAVIAVFFLAISAVCAQTASPLPQMDAAVKALAEYIEFIRPQMISDAKEESLFVNVSGERMPSLHSIAIHRRPSRNSSWMQLARTLPFCTIW